MAKRSNKSVNCERGPAHGTEIVLAPCSGQSDRGTRHRTSVSNCIVFRWRQLRSSRWSLILHLGRTPAPGRAPALLEDTPPR